MNSTIKNGLNPGVTYLDESWSSGAGGILRGAVVGGYGLFNNLYRGGGHLQSQVMVGNQLLACIPWSVRWLVSCSVLLLVVCDLNRDIIGCENHEEWLVRFDPLIIIVGQFDGNFKENQLKKPVLFPTVGWEHDVKSVTSLWTSSSF